MLKNKKGFAIILAWPQTFCKQAGGWYDPILGLLGISKNHYYQVGHAAVVLVNADNGTLHYFDFGRYHTPFGFGRVRSEKTDPDLKMAQKANISYGSILNLTEILIELKNRKACHGKGNLYGSLIEVDFSLAYKKAMYLQQISPIPYGPFVFKGNNCSRFVNDVVRAGKPSFVTWLKLMFPWTFSPTPIGNVKAAGKYLTINGSPPEVPSCPSKLDAVLATPVIHPAIPTNSKWLAGEGAGSWFHITRMAELFIVRRYSPNGELEFTAIYETLGDQYFFPESSFELGYPIHYEKITIIQAGNLILLKPISKYSKSKNDGFKEIIETLQLTSN
ncbi:DUF6695 family protein [Fontibacter flavus]|uniref:DUF6695 family protein n=1 Tax=Fontibacter flavus TaxID=654838 RepID=A0ABV6FV43_9BACT